MNKDSRKRLTLYLDKCIHEFESFPSGVSNICKHCKRWLDWNEKDHEELRLQRERKWDSWPDLGALMEKIVEKGEWNEFHLIVWDKWYDQCENEEYPNYDFILWLFVPTRFCELVDRWLEGKEKV